jgi:hypothetical protein
MIASGLASELVVGSELVRFDDDRGPWVGERGRRQRWFLSSLSRELVEDVGDRLGRDRAASECIGQSGVKVARSVPIEQGQEQRRVRRQPGIALGQGFEEPGGARAAGA